MLYFNTNVDATPDWVSLALRTKRSSSLMGSGRGGELPQPYHPKRGIPPPDPRPRKNPAPGAP